MYVGLWRLTGHDIYWNRGLYYYIKFWAIAFTTRWVGTAKHTYWIQHEWEELDVMYVPAASDGLTRPTPPDFYLYAAVRIITEYPTESDLILHVLVPFIIFPDRRSRSVIDCIILREQTSRWYWHIGSYLLFFILFKRCARIK